MLSLQACPIVFAGDEDFFDQDEEGEAIYEDCMGRAFVNFCCVCQEEALAELAAAWAS